MTLPGVEEFIQAAGAIFQREAFYENPIVNCVDMFGNIAQTFSSYESRHAQGEKPFERGVNSIQMLNDGKRCGYEHSVEPGATRQSSACATQPASKVRIRNRSGPLSPGAGQFPRSVTIVVVVMIMVAIVVAVMIVIVTPIPIALLILL